MDAVVATLRQGAYDGIKGEIAAFTADHPGQSRLAAINAFVEQLHKEHAYGVKGDKPSASVKARAEVLGWLLWREVCGDAGKFQGWTRLGDMLAPTLGGKVSRQTLKKLFVEIDTQCEPHAPSAPEIPQPNPDDEERPSESRAGGTEASPGSPPRRLPWKTVGLVVALPLVGLVVAVLRGDLAGRDAIAPSVIHGAAAPALAAALSPVEPPVIAVGEPTSKQMKEWLWKALGPTGFGVRPDDPCLAYEGSWGLKGTYRLDPDSKNPNALFSRARETELLARCRVDKVGEPAKLVGLDLTYADVFQKGHEEKHDRLAETLSVVQATITFQGGVPVDRQMKTFDRLTTAVFPALSKYYDGARLAVFLKDIKELSRAHCDVTPGPTEQEMKFHCASNSEDFAYDKSLSKQESPR